MLDVWDTGLAKEGAIIIEKRMEYIATLNDAAGKFHSALSSEKKHSNYHTRAARKRTARKISKMSCTRQSSLLAKKTKSWDIAR